MKLFAVLSCAAFLLAIGYAAGSTQTPSAVWGQGCYSMEHATVWAPLKDGKPDITQVHVEHIVLDKRPECWTYEIRRTK